MSSSAATSVFEITKSLGPDNAGRIKRLLENGVKIPAQPRVLEELSLHMKRSELDVRVLAKVINQDPGLTAMLFKVVGNSAYRQHQPFGSVEEILHAVGVRQTFNLVQAIALSSLGDIKKNRCTKPSGRARMLSASWPCWLLTSESPSAIFFPTRLTWPASFTIAACPC